MNRPPSWDAAQDFFEPDGTLRDLYVLATAPEHWSRFLSGLARSRFAAEFFIDDDRGPVPASFRAASDLRNVGAPRLEIEIGAVQALCFFFTPAEIELSFDPRDLRDEQDLHLLYDFMSWLGDQVRLPVHLTPEDGRERPYLTCDPQGQSWIANGGDAD